MSNKSSSKGNRVSSLLEQMSKHWQVYTQGTLDEHDIENIRYLTNKIQQLVTSQEKCRKDLMTNHDRGISMLLSILRGLASVDLQVSYNIMATLNEVLTSGKRMAIVIEHDAIQVLFHVLNVTVSKDQPRDAQLYEDVITILHTLLSKLGNKDKKFAVHARLFGAVPLTLTIAKQYSHSFKILPPLLQVMKIYGNSSVNCIKMVKEGSIGLLVKVLPQCGLKRTVTLKLSLELLSNLVKTKNGAKKAVIAGVVPILLNMFLEWQRLDHRNRQINLRKAILTCLRGVIMCSSGRKVLTDLDGLKIFYTVGVDGLDVREMDGVTKLLILILRRMVTRRLLIKRSTMLLTYALRGKKGGTKLKKVDSRSSKADSVDLASVGDSEHEESDVESDDECTADADQNPEEEVDDSNDQITTPRESSSNILHESPGERNDLDIYRAFMSEIDEYETLHFDEKGHETRDDISPRFTPIVIPVASMETDTNSNNIQDSSMQTNDSIRRWMPDTHSSPSFKPPFTEDDVEYGKCLDENPSSRGEFSAVEITVEGIRLQNGECDAGYVCKDRESASVGKTTAGQGVTCVRDESELEEGMVYAKRDIIREDQENGLFHLLPFVKISNPEKLGHYPPAELEPLLERKPGLPRAMVFQDFARFLHTDKIVNKVVYDLDDLIRNPNGSANSENGSHLSPRPSVSSPQKDGQSAPSSASKQEPPSPPLQFESRFECGNLRRAIQVRQHEYDLILSPDINSDHHHQWFYFEVQNMENGIPYKFNIINCEKFNSQFNFGMQPVLYSTKEALEGRPGWERAGYNVCYYKNYFIRKGIGQTSNRYFYTTTFTIKFPHNNDVCYIAYHYPYSYSMLQAHLSLQESRLPSTVYYHRQILCKSLLGNPCEMLTVTAKPDPNDDEALSNFRKRPYIVLTGRVHPGESSASWLMKGVLDYLLSSNSTAELLRSTYIFKIVPMLNPDGVINGCHRCSVAGEDLNRKWINPDPHLHPTIYHIKGLMQYLVSINKTPLVYCDFHGHSRRKNVFMYGCSLASTANARAQGNKDAFNFDLPRFGTIKSVENTENDEVSVSIIEEDTGYKTLPKILNVVAPAFCIQNCNFVVEKSKEGTGRVVVYKDLGVLRSYTLESTYCGADQGPYKGYHFSTRELEEMGKYFCIGLHKLSQSYRVKLSQEYFLEPRLQSSPDTDASKTGDEEEYTFQEIPSHSRLGLVQEPLLQDMLSTAED